MGAMWAALWSRVPFLRKAQPPHASQSVSFCLPGAAVQRFLSMRNLSPSAGPSRSSTASQSAQRAKSSCFQYAGAASQSTSSNSSSLASARAAAGKAPASSSRPSSSAPALGDDALAEAPGADEGGDGRGTDRNRRGRMHAGHDGGPRQRSSIKVMRWRAVMPSAVSARHCACRMKPRPARPPHTHHGQQRIQRQRDQRRDRADAACHGDQDRQHGPCRRMVCNPARHAQHHRAQPAAAVHADPGGHGHQLRAMATAQRNQQQVLHARRPRVRAEQLAPESTALTGIGGGARHRPGRGQAVSRAIASKGTLSSSARAFMAIMACSSMLPASSASPPRPREAPPARPAGTAPRVVAREIIQVVLQYAQAQHVDLGIRGVDIDDVDLLLLDGIVGQPVVQAGGFWPEP